jgi:RecB family exonuclease
VRLTGTTDRVRVLEDGRKGISDVKTGGRATEKDKSTGKLRAVTKGHHPQLGVYTLMAEAKPARCWTRRPKSSACRPPRARPAPRVRWPT